MFEFREWLEEKELLVEVESEITTSIFIGEICSLIEAFKGDDEVTNAANTLHWAGRLEKTGKIPKKARAAGFTKATLAHQSQTAETFLYNTIYPRIQRMAIKIVPGGIRNPDIDDVAQEAFLKISNNLTKPRSQKDSAGESDTFRDFEGRKFSSWMKTQVRNAFNTFRKKEARQSSPPSLVKTGETGPVQAQTGTAYSGDINKLGTLAASQGSGQHWGNTSFKRDSLQGDLEPPFSDRSETDPARIASKKEINKQLFAALEKIKEKYGEKGERMVLATLKSYGFEPVSFSLDKYPKFSPQTSDKNPDWIGGGAVQRRTIDGEKTYLSSNKDIVRGKQVTKTLPLLSRELKKTGIPYSYDRIKKDLGSTRKKIKPILQDLGVDYSQIGVNK